MTPLKPPPRIKAVRPKSLKVVITRPTIKERLRPAITTASLPLKVHV